MVTLSVPTVRDGTEDFFALFDLWKTAISSDDDVAFDFSTCTFIMQNGVAFLGGLAKLLEHDGRVVKFKWETIQPEIKVSLGRNGFLPFFGQPGMRSTGHAVGFRQDTQLDKESLVTYLVQEWIGDGRVKLSAALKEAVVSTAWEIYANAFEHAHSPVGVFSCGQHYPQRQLLELTVVDFGRGIPPNVRQFLSRPAWSGAEALEWAFRRGTTTKVAGIARGMGLDLLKEFVRINRGKLEIFSHDALAIIDSRKPKSTARELTYGKNKIPFGGTVVNIVFRCTPHYYGLASEVSGRPLF